MGGDLTQAVLFLLKLVLFGMLSIGVIVVALLLIVVLRTLVTTAWEAIGGKVKPKKKIF